MGIPEGLDVALKFGFMDSIFTRRSRRFGLGMEIKDGTPGRSTSSQEGKRDL